MNTPAHAIINLALLGRRAPLRSQFSVIGGAVLPDLPACLFYVVEKLVLGTPERRIFSEAYFDPRWQAFFDTFHSLPLIAVGLLGGVIARARLAVLFFASMGLHALFDLPLHHDDAHRHFFPFSDWRFYSPLSYWDPAHHGQLGALVEILAVLIAAAALCVRAPSRVTPAFVGVLGGCYLAYFAYAFTAW